MSRGSLNKGQRRKFGAGLAADHAYEEGQEKIRANSGFVCSDKVFVMA